MVEKEFLLPFRTTLCYLLPYLYKGNSTEPTLQQKVQEVYPKEETTAVCLSKSHLPVTKNYVAILQNHSKGLLTLNFRLQGIQRV